MLSSSLRTAIKQYCLLSVVNMFACKDQNVKLSNLQVRNIRYTTRQILDEKLDIPIWSGSICTCAMQSFTSQKRSFTAFNSAAMKLRVWCNNSFPISLKRLLICVTHFINSKYKNSTLSFPQANIRIIKTNLPLRPCHTLAYSPSEWITYCIFQIRTTFLRINCCSFWLQRYFSCFICAHCCLHLTIMLLKRWQYAKCTDTLHANIWELIISVLDVWPTYLYRHSSVFCVCLATHERMTDVNFIRSHTLTNFEHAQKFLGASAYASVCQRSFNVYNVWITYP